MLPSFSTSSAALIFCWQVLRAFLDAALAGWAELDASVDDEGVDAAVLGASDSAAVVLD